MLRIASPQRRKHVTRKKRQQKPLQRVEPARVHKKQRPSLWTVDEVTLIGKVQQPKTEAVSTVSKGGTNEGTDRKLPRGVSQNYVRVCRVTVVLL